MAIAKTIMDLIAVFPYARPVFGCLLGNVERIWSKSSGRAKVRYRLYEVRKNCFEKSVELVW